MLHEYLKFAGTEIANNERAHAVSRSRECPVSWLRQPDCLSLHEAEGPAVFGPWTLLHENLYPNPSFELSSGTVEAARNLFTNPGFRATSGTVEVWRNYVVRPSSEAGGWAMQASVGSTTTADLGEDGPVGFPSWQRRTIVTAPSGSGMRLGPTSSTESTVDFTGDATGVIWSYSDRPRTVAISIQFFDASATPIDLLLGADVAADEGWTELRAVFTVPTGAVSFRIAVMQREALVVGEQFGATAGTLVRGVYDGPAFSGDYSPDPDLTPSWTGTPNESESILSATVPADTEGGWQSSQWSASGAYSLRIPELDEVAGEPLDVLTTPGTTGDGLDLGAWEGRTLYSVFDKFTSTFPTSRAYAGIHSGLSTNPNPAGGLVFRSLAAGNIQIRFENTGGSQRQLGLQGYPAATTGRVIGAVGWDGENVFAASGFGVATAVQNDGTGQNPNNHLALAPPVEGETSPLVAIAYRGWHNDEQRAAVFNWLRARYAFATLEDQTFLITPRNSGQVVYFDGQEHVTEAGVPVRITGTGYVGLGPGWWDECLITDGIYDGPCFDGDTPDAGDFEYVWSGTEDESTSIQQAKGIFGVSDPGVYQSQEWAAGGDYSAFVPEGKSIKVALADPSTVKVVARSAGQTMVGSTGVEIRRNLASNPVVGTSTGWSVSGFGADGAGVAGQSIGGGPDGSNAYVATWSTAPSSGGAQIGYGRITDDDISVQEGLSYGISIHAKRSTAGSLTLRVQWHDSSGTLLSTQEPYSESVGAEEWTTLSAVLVAPAGATRVRVAARVLNLTGIPVGFKLSATRALVEPGTVVGDYFDGNTPASLDGIPVWAGTPNASETILYGVTSDTATGADETLEVQATGHAALLEGWWDKLAIIPGVYADGYFDGSTVPTDPNIEAYEWAGEPNASASRMLSRTAAYPLQYDQMQMREMPWYDSRHSASERFYGAYLTRVERISDSTRERGTTEGITSGGTAGRQRDAGASVRVRLWLTADGMDALEYGMTWLANALDGDRCSQHGDTCNGADLEFFTDCPPSRGDFVLESDYWAAVMGLRRYMHGVSAVSGPLEVRTRRSKDGRHYGREVEFTLYAEIPWVWSETRRPDIALFPPVVIEDTVGNLILTPSAALPDGLVQTAINYSTNPSVEVDAVGWSGAATGTAGSSPSPYFTSGRVDGELAAAGTASYRCRILGDGSTADSGQCELTAMHTVPIAVGPDGPRPSISIWTAALVSAGASGSEVMSMDARVEWLDATDAVLGTESLGSTTDPLNFGGIAFSGSSLVMPPSTTQARVVSRAQVGWESSATPANNSDIRLYTDAVAVTVP